MPTQRKKVADPIGPTPSEIGSAEPPKQVSELCEHIQADGGAVLGRYPDPFGGNWIVMAALPTEKVKPTPFQRLLSDAHAKRLEAVIPKVGRFLDPLVCIRKDGGYWTPNGMHRLEAMTRLGARSITALVIPEPEIAFRILALNTEKAHNLKDKSLEVVGMADVLAADEATADDNESKWAFEFEEPGFLTVGRCYQERGRYSGSAYMPVIKRCDAFFDKTIGEASEIRKQRSTKLLELDDAVTAIVKELKEKGMDNGYLKPVVVARLNPLRFSRKKKDAATPDFDATIDKMLAKAADFEVGSIKVDAVAEKTESE